MRGQNGRQLVEVDALGRQLKVLGKEVKLPGSTAKLNKPDFSEYLMKIEQLTEIPLPSPVDAGYVRE